jgi:hypothetical protein
MEICGSSSGYSQREECLHSPNSRSSAENVRLVICKNPVALGQPGSPRAWCNRADIMSRGSTIHEARSTRVDLLERINVLVMLLKHCSLGSDHSLPPVSRSSTK